MSGKADGGASGITLISPAENDAACLRPAAAFGASASSVVNRHETGPYCNFPGCFEWRTRGRSPS
jgi:hypothetical protein